MLRIAPQDEVACELVCDTNPRPEEPAKRASRRTAPARSSGHLALALASCPFAHAGQIVDRIKSAGVIRCGGVPRPGLVGQSPDGREAAGLYLDLCRAIGAALLGGDGKIEFHSYDSDHAFERVENGADDLSFLDGSDIADHRLAGKIALGPAVYFVSTAAMVRGDSAVQRLERSRRPTDLLLPGRQRPSAFGRLDGGASPELRPHGLHGIRRAS